MKKIIFIISILTLFAACSSIYVKDYEVYNDKDVKLQGKYLEDEDLVISITSFNTSDISFTIKNKLKSSIKLIVDECSIVDFSGLPHQVFVTGTKFIDKEKSKVPKVIPAGSTLADAIEPVDYAEFHINEGKYDFRPTGWYHQPFIEGDAKNYIGKSIKLLFMIEKDGKKKEYNLRLTIVSLE